MRNPVCRLRLALYGHPLSGAFWEQHCRKMLLSIGFEGISGCECCYMHRELKVVLSVYVDDFKMAGAPASMDVAWKKIKSVINVDDPTPLGKYASTRYAKCLRTGLTKSP